MGAWSVSITGNDTAQDLKYEYQAAFSCNDAKTAVTKLEHYVRTMFDESDEEEWCSYLYSLADYMWRHGILTDEVRDRAVAMIDSGCGLELWAEQGAGMLNKRNKVLAEFRAKLLSPQPPKKKIAVKLYTKPTFEIGDLVAIQLQTANKRYIPGSRFSEAFFRQCDGKYVVLRKVCDSVSYVSRVEPRVKDIWPVFELYGKVFDRCPTKEELKGVPKANTVKLGTNVYGVEADVRYNGTFWCEGGLYYFRKRKYSVIGSELSDLPDGYNRRSIFLGSDCPTKNADTTMLDCILPEEENDRKQDWITRLAEFFL